MIYVYALTTCLHIQRTCTKIISIMCRVMEFANAGVLMFASRNRDSLKIVSPSSQSFV